MIERPTNDESYRRMRGEVLDQLKERFRRARSECPCVSPEDIAYLRNVVRPALDQTKIGSAGRDFLSTGPLLPLILKEAGWLDTVGENIGAGWDYLKDQAGEAGSAIVDPIKNLGGGWWNSDLPWWANLAGDAGKVFDVAAAPGKALYNLGQGVAGGGLATVSQDALEAARTSDVGKGIDRAAEWVAGDLPFVMATGGGSLLARAGVSAIPKLLGRVGIDAAAGTAIPGVINKARGGDFVEGMQLPWSEKPLVEDLGAAKAPAPAATTAPAVAAPETGGMAPDYSGLFNSSYWRGGSPMTPPALQSFADSINNQVRSVVPSMG